ncbi:hypothetical protein PVK06_020867 [Gossypium arboreum]|uniref:Uncharacterized protein n=1 Tax=Gossypium arboreum TaxID=29729 RepID=A0ABR0PNM2_GOSAR|nr:hypothetical protein PVK06_020867 [Gossypium arboreum]
MDMGRPTLHLVYEMWDEMIEKVKTTIYRHDGKKGNEISIFYEVLNEVPNRLPPDKDVEISEERNKFLRRNFPSTEERKMTFQKFARFWEH